MILILTHQYLSLELIILITNQLSPLKYLKPFKANNTVDKTLYLGENNLGDIFNLLKDLKKFNAIN